MVMHGEKSYLVTAAEATWGDSPGSPVYYHLPVTAYGVTMKRDRRNTTPVLGLRQRKHGRSFRGMPSGSLTAMWYGYKPNSNTKSLAEILTTWAFGSPESIDLPSQLMDWAEGPDVSNVRHNGMRVNSATLEGSADSGTVTFSLELMGKTETALATAQTLPADREKIVEADFADCTFTLGGSSISLRSFKYSISNNITATYLNGTAPAFLAAGARVDSLTLMPMKTNDTWSALNRAFVEDYTTAVIVIKGLHNGTGTGGTNYTVCTITFNLLAFINPDDSRDIGKLIEQGLNFDVLKPDTSDDGVTIAWTEAA